jgi:outer membrane lipoprotein-sorting protein
MNNKTNMSREDVFDGEFFWSVVHNEKVYMKNKVSNQPLASFDKKEARSFKNEKGEAVFVKRPNPAFSSSADDVIFPQDYAFWLTPANHKILGEEKLLDRPVTVIEGQHDDSILAEKHQATHFKMWVDTKTGVLLKLVETNDKNEVTNSIEVLSIEFDKKADTAQLSAFTPPTDYKDVTRKPVRPENMESQKSEKE